MAAAECDRIRDQRSAISNAVLDYAETLELTNVEGQALYEASLSLVSMLDYMGAYRRGLGCEGMAGDEATAVRGVVLASLARVHCALSRAVGGLA